MGDDHPLAASFVARLATHSFDVPAGELEAELAAAFADAGAAWPGVALSAVELAGHLAACLGPGADRAALAALRPHAGELYLTRACAAGDPRALAHLEEKVFTAISGHLRRFDTLDIAEEALQLLRARLLLDAGQPPRILQYAGEGSLLGWVKVAAIRLATDLQRSRRRERTADDADDDADAGVAGAGDPELDYIKQRHRDDFKQAVQTAVQALTQQERSVLRLYALDGLNIDEIGHIFHVHRATVARWIATCRDKIRAETRRLLRERMGTAAEVESVLRLIESDLDASLHQVLKTEVPREV